MKFDTITGDDWKRELKIARETPNDISLQIKMKLKPENPTPGTPVTQPPIQPVTIHEIVSAMDNMILVLADANLDTTYRGRILFGALKRQVDDLKSRL